MSRSKRTTPDERLAVLVRLARRIKRAGRDVPNREDRRVAGKDAGVSHGTVASWMSRYPDEWARAREAAGLQTDGGDDAKVGSIGGGGVGGAAGVDAADLEGAVDDDPFANAAVDDLAPEFEIVVDSDPRVSQQQMRAIVLDLHGWGTRGAIAAEVGVCSQTVGRWLNHDPACRAVRAELERELAAQVRRSYLTILGETTQAQVQLARQVRKAARGRLQIVDGKLQRVAWDPDDLGKLARAATTLGADAADRAGFPKTAIQQHLVAGFDPDADLDEMSPDELEAEARRLEDEMRRLALADPDGDDIIDIDAEAAG